MLIRVNLLATGRIHELDVTPGTTVGTLKTLIEKQCAISQDAMRVMFNGRVLEADKNLSTLESLSIGEDANIVVMIRLNCYNVCAGQTKIDGVEKDSYGNAQGNKFDLARDGAFKGQIIAVLHLYTFGGFDFRFPEAALKQKGFEIKRWTTLPNPQLLEDALQNCCQLWMISSIQGTLEEAHMSVIKEFWMKGNGVYIWGENHPCYEDANRLGKYLIGATMSGNVPGGKIVKERPLDTNASNSKSSGFVQHLITTGLETLFEGVTVATIHQDRNFHMQQMKPLVYGSDMIQVDGKTQANLVTAVYEQDGRRLLIDTGFTRLYCNWDSAGTGRYVSNAAAWLANMERHQAYEQMDGLGLSIQREEVDELKSAFMLFDKSRTGYIDQKDLTEVLLSLGQCADVIEVNDMLDIIKTDNPDSEKISFKEFVGLMNHNIEDTNIEQEIYDAFIMFDQTNSKTITKDELKKVMNNLGTSVSDKDVIEMIKEADLDGQGSINYEEFNKILTGAGKNISKQEKTRLDLKAEKRHGSGKAAKMAHLRAAQRWDTLRSQVMKAVRRQRVLNQEEKTKKSNLKLDQNRKYHLLGLLIASLITAACIIIPLVFQSEFKENMKEAHKLRELTHQGLLVKYYDEKLTMSSRMAALTVAKEMTSSASSCNDQSSYYCCKHWYSRYIDTIPPLDAAIKKVGELAPDIKTSWDSKTAIANENLIAREEIALQICTTVMSSTYYTFVGDKNKNFQEPGKYPGNGLFQGVNAVFDEGLFEPQYDTNGILQARTITIKNAKLQVQGNDVLFYHVGNSTSTATLSEAIVSGEAVLQGKLEYWNGWTQGTNSVPTSRSLLSEVKDGSYSQTQGLYTTAWSKKFQLYVTSVKNQNTGIPSTITNLSTLKNIIASNSEDFLELTFTDPTTTYTYSAMKSQLAGGVEHLNEMVSEKVKKFDRLHWKNAMRNTMVLVVCALIQGFSIFLLILHEKKVVVIEHHLRKIEDELQDLKQRDWLTSEALPVLRSTIVEDIQRSWYDYNNSTSGGNNKMGQSIGHTSNDGSLLGASQQKATYVKQYSVPKMEKTESQKMRMTAIWTNKFKKIARLKKLMEHHTILRGVESKMRPFHKRQFVLMVVAEIVCLLCILIPCLFEGYNNNSIRQNTELRNLQQAGDLVLFYDEVLTMSSRMCVLRNDIGGWSTRYNSFLGPMDGALATVPKVEGILVDDFGSDHQEESVGKISSNYNSMANTANGALIDLETTALSVCTIKGLEVSDPVRYNIGKNALFGSNYKQQKSILTNAIQFLESKIGELVKYQEDADHTRTDVNILTIGLVAALLITILSILGSYQFRLMSLEKQFLEAYRMVMKYESRDWLTNDALLTLRTNIISDVRRATLRRYEEATDSQKEHIEVLNKPKDLQIVDIPVTPSTMRFMEHQ